MRVSNRKNKNARVDFLNSDEQTEQDFRRAIIKWDYVPKTNYSGFAPEQAVGERNGKKSGDGLFKNLTVLSAAAVKAQNPANELKDNG